MRKILGCGLILLMCSLWTKADIPLTDSLVIRLQADALQAQGLSDGDSVVQWLDLANADSIDGTVSMVSGQETPHYVTDGLNGRAVVRFNNAHVLGSAPFSWLDVNQGITIIAVCTGDKSGFAAERLYGIGDADGTGGQYLAQDVSISTSGTDAGSGVRFNNGKSLVATGNPLSPDFHITAIKIGQSDVYQDVCYYVDNAILEVFETWTNPTNPLNFPDSNNTFVIGNSRLNGTFPGTDYYSGDLAEILVYNRQLNTTEISEMIDYLKIEYGLDRELPVADGIMTHLDASSLEGLNDGDAVNIWADLATDDTVNGTVSQVGSNSVPTYYSNVTNGKSVVRFNDAQILGSAVFSWPDVDAGVTILAVFTGDRSGLSGERFCGIGHATGASGQIVALDASTNTIDGDGGSGLRFNNGKTLVKAANPLDPSFHIAAIQIDQNAAYQSVRYFVDRMDVQVFDNLANPTSTLTLPATDNILTIGNSWINGSISASDFFSGDVAEILVYNRMLSETEIETMQSYFYNKYFYSLIEIVPRYLELDEGQSDTMSLQLNDAPTEDVVVLLVDPSEPSQVTILPETILYTSSNWDNPVSVQVTAIDNSWPEGMHRTDVQVFAQSADLDYQDVSTTVMVSIFDNECSAINYTPEDLNQDCRVDLSDIALLVEYWLWCDPMKDILCDDLR